MRTMLFTTVAALPLLLAVPATAQTPEMPPPAGRTQPAPTTPGGAAPEAPAARQQQMPEGGTSPSGTTRPQTGQAAPGETAPMPKAGKQAQEPPAAGTQQRQKATTDAGPERGALSAEKRTTVRQSIVKHRVKPVTNVNFNVVVGTAVPRTVELQVLPPEVVEIVPQYRGFRFFVLADGRIVIVDPSTYEIVFIIA